MTTKRDLKKLIRDSMKKTGESYSSARRALLADPPVLLAPKEAAEPAPHVGAGEIDGWIAAGQAPQDYEFKIDTTGYRSSRSAVVRARKEKPSGFATLTQRFIPDDYRGQRVRLSGAIRSEGVTGSCKLWMRVENADGRVVAFGQSPLITGTTEWSQHRIVLDVDQDAAVLAFGILLENGAGTGWLSDVALQTVGKDIPTSDLMNASPPHSPRNLDFTEQSPSPTVGVSPLQDVCERLQRDSNALATLLLGSDGAELARSGDATLLDANAVRSLFAASGGEVVDDRELAGQVHPGTNRHVHVSLVAQRAMLAVLFDVRSSLGLVRLRVKKASEMLARLLGEGPSGSGGPMPPQAAPDSNGSPAPAQIGDEDEPLH